MGEQKNLFLAIGLSIAIIVIFQFLSPQQALIDKPINKETSQEVIEPSNSIDDNQSTSIATIKSRDEIISKSNRVNIKTPSLIGSINLTGAILDDLILTKYNKRLNDDSEKITLFSPDGTTNPYYFQLGWNQLKSSEPKVDLPNHETIWAASSSELTPDKPVILSWTNNQNIKFQLKFSVDNDYLFDVIQTVENNSSSEIKLFPYRLIKRINLPDTINFFILHEGLISLTNDKLQEKKYDHLLDDCNEDSDTKKLFCNETTTGGWLGFTDKYWMATLIPDQEKTITADYRHKNNGRDDFRVGYTGNNMEISPQQKISYNGKIFAGAKSLKILSNYMENGIPKFTDSIDWGWFAFLTKPISYALNWFYSLKFVENFGLAIIAFTILMRLILFPLAQASFKSMAKMKKLQPEMQRLKETYPDDRQKMQQELMALYKKEGANPVAGCLPVIVQIPIFFSLYKVLFVTIEMYHAPFYGWIHDLSAPDPIGLMTLFGLIDWEIPKRGMLSILNFVNIGILPIFMGFTMWLQQKLNPAPADPTQAKIFALLPFVFTFVLAGFAAGLVLYWSINNILSIAQQWFIQRRILAKNA
ncbi:membrane protein insertase YidC [Alphaproteobacteria bacterium]|nr:membrane protein insertase YidC [Alphaproteobacteria bacterium]